MTRHLVVTTCNEAQWDKYGRKMARSFLLGWPDEVPLWLFHEGFDPAGELPIERCADLELASPWLRDFKAKYGHQDTRPGEPGYDYRRDAVRFAHKVAAIHAAAQDADCDVLIWMDADTVTFETVTEDWLRELFPAEADLAWLDREGVYPECGFLMFRMPQARKLIAQIVDCYDSGAIFNLRETHDSFVIQHVAEAAAVRGEIRIASLSGPEGRRCTHHPWVNSRLAERLDHLKGARKDTGHSRRSDIVVSRPEPYWQEIRRTGIQEQVARPPQQAHRRTPRLRNPQPQHAILR